MRRVRRRYPHERRSSSTSLPCGPTARRAPFSMDETTTWPLATRRAGSDLPVQHARRAGRPGGTGFRIVAVDPRWHRIRVITAGSSMLAIRGEPSAGTVAGSRNGDRPRRLPLLHRLNPGALVLLVLRRLVGQGLPVAVPRYGRPGGPLLASPHSRPRRPPRTPVIAAASARATPSPARTRARARARRPRRGRGRTAAARWAGPRG